MNYDTMYERLMDLPLFKGTSHDRISSFVEKTKLIFEKYPAGQVICEAGQPTHELLFIISGQAAIDSIDTRGSILIRQICGEGTMLGADSLFGMYQWFPARISAHTPCGVLRIAKNDILELISKDNIYLVNFLNHLSFKIQRTRAAIVNSNPTNVAGFIRFILHSLTRSEAKQIFITSSPADIARHLPIPPSRIRRQLDKLIADGLIEITPDSFISILSEELRPD